MERIYEERKTDIYGDALLIPTEPQEEIIRCRDCKYARKDEPMRCYQFRFKDNGEYQGVNYVEPNGFCAWAERVD